MYHHLRGAVANTYSEKKNNSCITTLVMTRTDIATQTPTQIPPVKDHDAVVNRLQQTARVMMWPAAPLMKTTVASATVLVVVLVYVVVFVMVVVLLVLELELVEVELVPLEVVELELVEETVVVDEVNVMLVVEDIVEDKVDVVTVAVVRTVCCLSVRAYNDHSQNVPSSSKYAPWEKLKSHIFATFLSPHSGYEKKGQSSPKMSFPHKSVVAPRLGAPQAFNLPSDSSPTAAGSLITMEMC